VSDFVQGLGFGLILQISVGPVCIAILHKGLTQGFRHAFSMVWGAALVDALYIVLSVAGVSALLAYFGIRYLLAPAATARIEHSDESPLKSFTFGVGLTLTNPLTILFWAGVLGAMMSSHTFEQPGGVLFFSAGCVAATLLFLTAVAAAGHYLERVLTDRLSLWLNRAVGLFLLAFAIKLAADLFLTP
jgi:threonine/homoserine/homoserine lactone efflux protein